MIFGAKRPVDPEEWEWLLAGFKWLEREFPQLQISRTLILPTKDYFPPVESDGAARGEEIMRQVQLLAGMAAWPIHLEGVERAPATPLNNVAAVQHGEGAAGTFRLKRTADGAVCAEIRYDLDQLNNPSGLVATFAHELSHYLLHACSTPFPGGDEIEELFTDLTAVWLGFGIFLGNNARYGGHVDEGGGRGWFVSGWQGYLSERMLMTALAMSETLACHEPMLAAPFLKDYLVSDLKMAKRYAAHRNLRQEMDAIDLADFGA